ncbi:MAG: TniQ family protein [Lachnospiraceae bacterium]
MIAYLPALYEDELVYSWFARYFAHMYPSYINAVEDLMENRNTRTGFEFINHLDADARKIISRVIPMKDLIIWHTMFPSYRFSGHERLCNALESMINTVGDVHRMLPISKSRTNGQVHYIKYCPLCAAEARETHGEAYWTRQANIRDIGICVKHKCKLKNTNIRISGKQSARLFVAETEIKDVEPEFVKDGLELQFARYLTEVFQKPVNMNNTIGIGEFLNSRLEGTRYLSARGKMRNVTLLFNDMMEFYGDIPNQGISKLNQMQKIFTGYRWDFYEVCQMAFFLNISADDLINPQMPNKSQTELFNERVGQLYARGLGCHKIARKMGCSPTTAKNANRVQIRAEHDYSGRKGIKRDDWDQMDEEMLQQVRNICEQIYYNAGGRPGHVTVNAVCRALGFPDKRFDYLPKCREVIYGYEEKKEVYWAREVVWCYQDLLKRKGEEGIRWRDIRDVTNLRKENFIASFPHFRKFTDEEMAAKIKALLLAQNPML